MTLRCRVRGCRGRVRRGSIVLCVRCRWSLNRAFAVKP